MSRKVLNTETIREELSDLYFSLKEGRTELEVAAELNDIAGKMLSSMKIDIMRETLSLAMMKRQPKMIEQ